MYNIQTSTDNLYAVDGNLFTSSGSLNPVLNPTSPVVAFSMHQIPLSSSQTAPQESCVLASRVSTVAMQPEAVGEIKESKGVEGVKRRLIIPLIYTIESSTSPVLQAPLPPETISSPLLQASLLQAPLPPIDEKDE